MRGFPTQLLNEPSILNRTYWVYTMSLNSLKKLLLVSLLSTLSIGTTSKPITSPKAQYAEYTIRERATLDIKKTTVTDSQIIDWISIESQGNIAEPPPPLAPLTPDPTKETSRPLSELELPGVEIGPPGTVPVPRINLTYLAKAASKQLPRSTPSTGQSKRQYSGDHWYVSSDQPVNNIGGSAVFSLFNAYVENPGDFSLLQTAVTRSTTNGLQTLEAGWINYPNQVSQPHLFTYYTTNGYSAGGGWPSVDGGTQYEMQLGYQLSGGNWWLWVINRWVGYYPASLYSANQANPSATLEAGSDTIYYYGEIYQSEGPLTTTDMGSGEFAGTGFGHAGYIHNMDYVDTNSTAQYYTAGFGDSDSSRYNADPFPESGTTWGSYTYLGGPGAGEVVGG
ncbi:hypothetical protein G7Y89_g10333 [Cudoniella acicularis]|uniref:Neprosin PEP catalytic domain-containing protein n=1 Tax=Cudoniella acicularis TaxID=354080 RepID=A0A8H4RCZ5_9HELO|nr:hypothetical protein G7Y89_g10333 [Cudoniella acicularis]